AEARAPGGLFARIGASEAFEAENVRERQAQQAEAADAQQIAAGHAVTGVTTGETGNDQHGFDPLDGAKAGGMVVGQAGGSSIVFRCKCTPGKGVASTGYREIGIQLSAHPGFAKPHPGLYFGRPKGSKNRLGAASATVIKPR